MPIYEFRCQACQELFELLIMNADEQVEIACPKCGADTFERVLSTTSYAVADGPVGGGGVRSRSRTCPSGSCTTYEIPGPTR